MEKPEPPLTALLDVLRWRGGDGDVGRWRARYDERLLHRLDVARGLLAEQDPEVAFLLQITPDADLRRLARAPSISDGLLRADGPFLREAVLIDALLADFAAREGRSFLKRPVWSAHGDRRFAPDGILEPVRRGDFPLPLDTQSPFQLPRIERGGNDMAPLAPAEVDEVVRRLRDALEAIGTVSQVPSQLVSRFNEVIVLRTEREEPDTLRSGTFDRYIGLVLLTNAHLPRATREQLADALIHETIHNVLFTFEATFGGFIPQQEMPVFPTLKSPWTGAVLALPSFIHACIVWYGLYAFWKRAESSDARAFDEGACNRLKSRAAAGFAAQPATVLLAPHRPLLSDAAREMLAGVEAAMLAE